MSEDEVVDAVRQVESPADAQPTVDELTGPERRLDGRVRYLWAARATVSALVLSLITGVAGFVVLNELWPAAAVFTFLFVVGLALTVARYRAWLYEVRDDSLFLRRGVFTRVRTVVPYVRIQHVDVSEGPFERALGLASVVVYTAGSRGADVTIPGLTPERADDLQTRLKQLAIVAEGEDAV
ncbi:PH domain-containing protein [Halorarius litoreus]|uniref:PH domain-containing protein n=1 Tax=Halorarius litoreus TaxID=2962676 RepID=UPI0020CE27D3|nr:PH domain-containing protein [Halorarius litoreus]